jgi:hypothetical protein
VDRTEIAVPTCGRPRCAAVPFVPGEQSSSGGHRTRRSAPGGPNLRDATEEGHRQTCRCTRRMGEEQPGRPCRAAVGVHPERTGVTAKMAVALRLHAGGHRGGPRRAGVGPAATRPRSGHAGGDRGTGTDGGRAECAVRTGWLPTRPGGRHGQPHAHRRGPSRLTSTRAPAAGARLVRRAGPDRGAGSSSSGNAGARGVGRKDRSFCQVWAGLPRGFWKDTPFPRRRRGTVPARPVTRPWTRRGRSTEPWAPPLPPHQRP